MCIWNEHLRHLFACARDPRATNPRCSAQQHTPRESTNTHVQGRAHAVFTTPSCGVITCPGRVTPQAATQRQLLSHTTQHTQHTHHITSHPTHHTQHTTHTHTQHTQHNTTQHNNTTQRHTTPHTSAARCHHHSPTTSIKHAPGLGVSLVWMNTVRLGHHNSLERNPTTRRRRNISAGSPLLPCLLPNVVSPTSLLRCDL